MSLLWCPKGSSLSKPWTCSYSSDYFHHHAKEISLLWVLFTAMLSIPFCREWEVWTKHNITWLTVFENQPKSRIQHAKRATFTFWVDKNSSKMVQFDEFLTNWSYHSNSVARKATFNRTKIDRKCQNWKIQMRHFGWFSSIVLKSEISNNFVICRIRNEWI